MTEARRRRSPAMSADKRRAAIVDAALPLLAEHGATVTTRQIALAADVAEGTLFRVFPDKEAILRACVGALLDTGEVTAEIRALPADAELADRLTDAAELFLAHFERAGQLMHALVTTGQDLRELDPDDDPGSARTAYFREMRAALAEATGTEAAALRIEPEELAAMLLGQLMGLHLDQDQDRRNAVRRRIDVLLRGALARHEEDDDG
ncbi:TetR/AcrR family transcriptional regulator [Saccharopolyspora sp. CA-218241]|uniref:TetR/AcrR family transcriptional regulator n=1 Tax=Saccharopolyspora sp. CA-218241 TaxID=3240027 RepID=UPI003D993624